MSPFKAKKLGFLAAGITAIALLAAQGCSSGDDSQAAPPAGGAGGGHAGSAGKSGAGAGTGAGTGESGATNNNGGSGNAGNTEGGSDNNSEAGAGGEAGTPPINPGCVDASGCYIVSSSCTQTTSIEFLNACVAGGCPAHFDNATLTKLNLVGTL